MLKMFKDMLPKNLTTAIDNLNNMEKGELVTFLTSWFKGDIKMPATKEELVEFLKQKLPTAYDKIDSLNSTFYGKFTKLKPETQDLLRSWKNKMMDVNGATPAESASKQLQILREFAGIIQTMDSTTRDDLRSQFPTAVKLTEGFGFTVLTTIAMIIQKIRESLTPAAVSATQSALDCAIPLD